jgi:hypothetical protein
VDKGLEARPQSIKPVFIFKPEFFTQFLPELKESVQNRA